MIYLKTFRVRGMAMRYFGAVKKNYFMYMSLVVYSDFVWYLCDSYLAIFSCDFSGTEKGTCLFSRAWLYFLGHWAGRRLFLFLFEIWALGRESEREGFERNGGVVRAGSVWFTTAERPAVPLCLSSLHPLHTHAHTYAHTWPAQEPCHSKCSSHLSRHYHCSLIKAYLSSLFFTIG